jgi:hypothetical protein
MVQGDHHMLLLAGSLPHSCSGPALPRALMAAAPCPAVCSSVHGHIGYTATAATRTHDVMAAAWHHGLLVHLVAWFTQHHRPAN